MTEMELRKKIINKRNQIQHREKRSHAITKSLLKSNLYKEMSIILAYSDIGSEVSTAYLLSEVLKDKKILFLPKVTDEINGKMDFYKVDCLEQLHTGYQNIMEPTSNIRFDPKKEKALMIVPCVAFDSSGTRMGYGKGYYDRYLAVCGKQIQSILLAFKEQEVKSLIRKDTDIPIENRIIG